jgi:hypothetical protein
MYVCTHGKAAAKDERANEFAASADAEYRGYCVHAGSVYRATLLATTLAKSPSKIVRPLVGVCRRRSRRRHA